VAKRRELNALEYRFVDELLADPTADPIAAARRAGAVDPETVARKFGRDPAIQAATSYARRAREERLGIRHDYVLKRWLLLLSADPRELVEHWLIPCRYCWGVEGRYQRTDAEYRADEDAWERRERDRRRTWERTRREDYERFEEEPFDEAGGPGYTINAEPRRGPDWVKFVQRNARLSGTPLFAFEANHETSCGSCHGHGIPHTIFHDTRHVSPAGALLFRGLKVDGTKVEVVMRDQDAAAVYVAKHQGYFVDRKVFVLAGLANLSDAELRDETEAALETNRRLRELARERDLALPAP
jgi:phage terminase small subunit